MSERIHIPDLGQPLLTEQQRAAVAYGETLEVDLSADSILGEARRATGLIDFGPEDFLERLHLLCNEWDQDKDLLTLGRLSLRNKLLQHAKNRLLIQSVLQRHPEIHQVEIAAPIVVAGLPRSGTTHLLNLMAADRRLRALPLWESYEPVPMPTELASESGMDPRYQRCESQWQTMQALSPLLAAMHPMNPEHIHEELELMGPDFASYNYEWLSVSPRWRDNYYATDQTPHYEYMKTVLKILTWQDGDTSGRNTRWVLKCPQHLEQLTVLHRVFPDASIAITHRDPVSVIQSAITMIAYGQRMSRRRIDLDGLIQYWSDRVVHLLQACTADRHKIPEAQSIDVLFHEFMADDMAMVERIYRKADLAMTPQARGQLQAFLDAHPRGKHGRIVYNLREDFGVEPAQLRSRFNFYFDRFPVQLEVK
ncbi:sulfotransferase [bacterium]|nr:sulfotransferase [bacterium]